MNDHAICEILDILLSAWQLHKNYTKSNIFHNDWYVRDIVLSISTHDSLDISELYTTRPTFETALLQMCSYFRVFKYIFAAVLMIGASNDYRLEDRFHNGWNFATDKSSFAFWAKRVMRLNWMTLLKPYFDAICAKSILTARLLTACNWLPHDVMTNRTYFIQYLHMRWSTYIIDYTTKLRYSITCSSSSSSEQESSLHLSMCYILCSLLYDLYVRWSDGLPILDHYLLQSQ